MNTTSSSFPGVCGGAPVPVGPRASERLTVDASHVVAVGRFGTHGDAVARLLVRLADGTEYQVMHQDQDDEATARWLRRTTRKWNEMPRTDRHIGWSVIWHVLAPQEVL